MQFVTLLSVTSSRTPSTICSAPRCGVVVRHHRVVLVYAAMENDLADCGLHPIPLLLTVTIAYFVGRSPTY